MDRSLPIPGQALSDAMQRITAIARQDRLRQTFPGATRVAPTAITDASTRTAFSLTGYQNIAKIDLDAGSWIFHARALLSIENNPGAQLYTGRETAYVRLIAADTESLIELEEIDSTFAQPSSPPETFYNLGFMDLNIPLFGYTSVIWPFSGLLAVQVVDTETAAHAVTWRTKIMAVPA
jgi:hypothetical protein